MQKIRLVAVDEDGTFLRDHAYYNKERFERIWRYMQTHDIRFVVATGNQCYQVQELFSQHVSEMGIVSANGAYVLDGTEPVFAAQASGEVVRHMIDACHRHPDVPFSMLGVDAAYIERGTSREFFDDMAQYCFRQYWVDDFGDVSDQIFMFSSVVDQSIVRQCIGEFREVVGTSMDVVGSGEGYFDIVCPGINKATGLQHLLRRWDILPEECIAFGDSDNDIKMLELVGKGYAMANAPSNVRKCADAVAPSCDDEGVLQVLEELFGL